MGFDVLLAVSNSIWVVIGPALIAGTIGLVSALLSFSSSRATLRRSSEDSAAERAHQRAMLVFDRRLLAIEAIWQRIFEIERTGKLGDEAQIEIVRAVVWLPDEAKREVLTAVKGQQEERDMTKAFQQVRKTLEALTEKYEEEKA